MGSHRADRLAPVWECADVAAADAGAVVMRIRRECIHFGPWLTNVSFAIVVRT